MSFPHGERQLNGGSVNWTELFGTRDILRMADLPNVDMIPPDIPYDNFKYYMDLKRKLLED